MRLVSEYRPRPLRFKKIKAMFVTMLLLAMAFMAGAIAEKTAHFLQEVAAVTPVVLDEIKGFFHERFFIKFNTAADQFKWATAITLAIITDPFESLIRGP